MHLQGLCTGFHYRCRRALHARSMPGSSPRSDGAALAPCSFPRTSSNSGVPELPPDIPPDAILP